MIAAATATLCSLDPDRNLTDSQRAYLFAAYWDGTKGEKLNMPMGTVKDLISELEELPPDICPVQGCEIRLRWQPLAEPSPDNPGYYATNPLSIHYPYREY